MQHSNAWHTLQSEQIAKKLETNAITGLTRKQAVKRRRTLQVRRPEATTPLFLPMPHPVYSYILKMFFDPIVILGLFIAVVAVVFKEYLLGGTVAGLILLNCITCGVAYFKARSIPENLSLYANPMVKVIRSGKMFTADARHVVPGDVVVLTPGDICPADVRLHKGSAVSVLQYVYNPSAGEMVQRQTDKEGNRLYSPDEHVHNPDIANIVYAGSVIEQGYGIGIAVETGSFTYVGAINGTVPGTAVNKDPVSLSHIKKQCIRMTTLQAILLLPLTVLLSVTMSNTMTIAECFLVALGLSLTCVTEHILSLSRMIVSAGLYFAAEQTDTAATAIIKNHTASDMLCDMTDLFLFDACAISDGKYHMESVYAGGAIYTDREFADRNNLDVIALASDLYLYRSATRPPESAQAPQSDDVFAASIDALIKHLAIDTTALTWNRKSSFVTTEGDCRIAHNDMKNGEYQVLVSESDELLEKCGYMQSNGASVEFDKSNFDALKTLCRIYRESGYRILLTAHKENDAVTLMGVIAFAQRIGSSFSECCSQIIDSGVRISVFMEDTPETIKILSDSELVRDQNNDVLTAARAENEGLDLTVAYGSYRAYLGFSDFQIAELITSLKSRGNKIAAYCIDREKQSLQKMADLRVTCDAVEYRSDKVAESLYERMPVDGKPHSTRASQSMRRDSDIVLRRASLKGGGLHGILTGRAAAFAINHNLANMMTYLLTVMVFRTVLVAVPALFGTPTLSPVSMLICGLVLDVLFGMLFAFNVPNQGAIASSYPIMRRLERPLAYNTANVISACVSALVLWLSIAVLRVTRVLSTPEQAMALSFISTYLLQGAVFLITTHEYTTGTANKLPSKMRLIAIVGYICLLAACLCVPGIDELTAGADLNAVGFLLCPLATLIYYGLYRLLSAKGLNLHK